MAEANNKLGANGLVLGAQTPSEISGHDDAGTGKVLLYASGSGAQAKLYYKGGGTTQRALGTDIESLTALTGSGLASLKAEDLMMVADQDRAEGNEVKITMTQLGSFLAGSSGSGLDSSSGALSVDVSDFLSTGLEDNGNAIRLSAQGTGIAGGAGSTLSVAAAQTSIESIINSSLGKIGTDAAQEYIDFGTSDEVNVHIDNNKILGVTSAGAGVTGDLTVSGDLTVNGDLVQQNVSQLVVEDTLIGLGYGASATGSVGDRGLVMGLNGENAVAMIWDESESQFAFARTSTDNKATAATIAAYAPMKAAAIQGTSLSGSSTLDVDGEAKLNGNVKVKALTSSRVVFAGANGLLSDDSNMTFATDTLTVTKLGAFEAAGAINFASQNMTNVDIDSGTIDGATIATSDVTVGAGKTLDVSAGTLTLANDQIAAAKVTGLDGTGLTDTSGQLSVDAAQPQISTVGVLASGSIASGFGTISTANNITTTQTISGSVAVQGGAATFASAIVGGLTAASAISKPQPLVFGNHNKTLGSDIDLAWSAELNMLNASGSVAVQAKNNSVDGIAFANSSGTRVAAMNANGLTILQGASKIIDFGNFAGGTQAKIANGSGASMLNLSSSAGLHLQLNNAQHANNVITVNAGGNASNQAIVVEGGKGIIAAFLDVNSDRELKKDIAPMSTSNLLDKVMSLEPVSYEMKWAPGTADLGFIAQDVAKIVPEVCRTDQSGIARSIDYSRLTTILAGAVQEQQVQINDLKEIIAKLQK